MIILVVIINPGQGGQPKTYRRLEVDNFSSPSLGEAWLSWSLRCLSPTPTVHTARGWSGLKGSSFIRSKKDAKRAQWQQDSITLFWENTRKHQKTMSDSVNNWFTNASSTWPALVMGMSWPFAAVCQENPQKDHETGLLQDLWHLHKANEKTNKNTASMYVLRSQDSTLHCFFWWIMEHTKIQGWNIFSTQRIHLLLHITYIYHKHQLNAGKYIIHGWYGV